MSNELTDWANDCTEEEIKAAILRCQDNGWWWQASVYTQALNDKLKRKESSNEKMC